MVTLEASFSGEHLIGQILFDDEETGRALTEMTTFAPEEVARASVDYISDIEAVTGWLRKLADALENPPA